MGTIFKTCIFLAGMSAVFGQLGQQSPAADIYFREGVPVNILCNITSKLEGKAKYSWLKNGKPLDQSESTITIAKPKAEDEGVYICHAETSQGIASSAPTTVKRAYLNAPKVNTVEHVVKRASPYKLDCKYPDAYPRPEITWELQKIDKPSETKSIADRRILIGPDAVLYFTNVTDEDVQKGYKYVCLAKSVAVDKPVPLAEHVFKKLEDTKESFSELVPLYLNQDMTVKAGDITMIYCIYGSTPMAYPDWFYGDKNVNNKPEDRITRYNRSSGKRLLIKDTYLSDSGTYTCKVDNEVGKPQSHSIKLTVVSAPKILKRADPVIKAKAGQDVMLPCEVQGLPQPKLVWTHNAKPIPYGPKYSLSITGSKTDLGVVNLTLKKVEKSDSGYYGCLATNEHGVAYAETLVVVE